MELLTPITSPEVGVRAFDIAVLPVGSFEQHGSHLPLVTDTVIACIIGQAIADAYSLFLLPPITITCSHEHDDFPGTVSIRPTTLIRIIDDVRASLARKGIHKLVLVNGHGGNYVLNNVAQEANVDGPSVVVYPPGVTGTSLAARPVWRQRRMTTCTGARRKRPFCCTTHPTQSRPSGSLPITKPMSGQIFSFSA